MKGNLIVGALVLMAFAASFNAQERSVSGIGAVIGVEAGKIVIRSTLPESPAARAGFPKGSVLRSIDGASTEAMKLAEVVERLRGPAGSSVNVEFVDPAGGDPVTL